MRRYLLATVALALAIVAVVSLSVWYFERPVVVRVTVARDTPDHQLMTAVAAVMARERETLRLRVTAVDNASASAAAIDNGSTDFAVVRTDIDMPRQGQTVAILHSSPLVILAPGGSGVTQIADLKGRSIGVLVPRPGAGANARLVDALLAHYDASEGTRKETLTADELPQALADHRIDALIAVGDPAANQLNEVLSLVAAAGRGPVEFVPVLEGKALSQRSPIFEPVELPRGAFGGATPRPSRDVQTIGVSTRLVARARTPDATVGEMVRILFATRPLIAAAAPQANRMEAPSTNKGATLPVHPGAAAYLDGEEESFLDKYSDFIYLGAMLLSVLASAAAALASRLTAANHARSEELMQLLLEHLATAREAASSVRLDELEREADMVLAQALEAGSLRHLDTHRVTALGLAIDQVRLAIRDRRRQIEAGDPAAPFETPRILAG
jgi:TRAP transporter TAXI family solute receptor